MKKKNNYKLIDKVLEASSADLWDEAVLEWEIIDVEEDETCESECICGKEHIRYLYTIRNEITGKELYPIGSSCIKKFGRDDLDEELKVQKSLFELYHDLEEYNWLEFPGSFTRKLLLYLYQNGAFPANKYNEYDGRNDYEFLLKMFNKKDKESITEAQYHKINAIISNSIKPYLKNKLHKA